MDVDLLNQLFVDLILSPIFNHAKVSDRSGAVRYN